LVTLPDNCELTTPPFYAIDVLYVMLGGLLASFLLHVDGFSGNSLVAVLVVLLVGLQIG
jgi:hypothetical protein